MLNIKKLSRLHMTKHALISVSLLAAVLLSGNANAQSNALDIDQLIRATKAAAKSDKNAETARENRFKSDRNHEQGRLTSMKNERARQERLSDQLDAQFNVNETNIEELQVELSKELGDLKELFGVIQTTASEAQEDYKTSLISAQYPQRSENLRQMVEKMSSLTELVSISEIEGLWVELQNEMTEQSKIVKFNAPLNFVTGYEAKEDGSQDKSKPIYEAQEREITRIGVFNAISGNDIATYKNNVGLIALDRQMRGSFSSKSVSLQGATSGVTSFLVDPTKGALLSAFVRKPSLWEKVQEGGVVGYVIMTLGAIAAVIAIFRLVVLTGVAGSVRKQARDLKRPSLRNPLGRILKVYQDNPNSDPESMELKLGEAMLRESPKINAWVMFIKIIAVVAPLLGLLGTVTGMIQTFQAITLYGAGDPQTMAGGISQALVTTVLGLVVAIPTVFLHWMVSSRARGIEGALEEHATGLIADQWEGQK
jgi:biopolymer transport protein ExbB